MIDLGMLYEISWLWIELDSGNMEQQYLEGTLVAEVYDTKKKNLVWIAVGTSRNFNKDSKREFLVLILIIIYFTISITWYEHWLKIIFPLEIFEDPRINDIIILAYRFFFIVGIPILIYFILSKCSLRKWGIINHSKAFLSKGSIFTFIIMTSVLLSFQYFMGNGAKQRISGLL